MISSVGTTTTTTSYQKQHQQIIVANAGCSGTTQSRSESSASSSNEAATTAVGDGFKNPAAEGTAPGSRKYEEMVLQNQQQQHHRVSPKFESTEINSGGTGDYYGGTAGAATTTTSMSEVANGSVGGGGPTSIGVVAVAPPRLHPKKRKYDPTEAEQFATDLSAGGGGQSQQRDGSYAQHLETGSVVFSQSSGGGIPPVEVMVSAGGLASGGGVVVATSTIAETSAMAGGGPAVNNARPIPELDLRDWCETRVLAKYKRSENVYVQAVIKSSDSAVELLVEFEGSEGGFRQKYDVINCNRFDIIADASPSISDVSANYFRYLFRKLTLYSSHCRYR